MKNYSVNEVVGKLGRTSGINVSGKKITVNASQGIGTWGRIDFLKNHAGYSVISLVR